MRVVTALAIAGSDSSGGAGIQADLRVFAAFGVHGTSAITAVTAQNAAGVAAMMPVTPSVVTAQIESVATGFTVNAVKTGMLANAAIVTAVVSAIDRFQLPFVVVDPVILATAGQVLLDEDGVIAMCAELLPRAFVVTPNIPEAAFLAGQAIDTRDDMRAAAETIRSRCGAAVVIKGGHARDTGDGTVVDLLFDGECFTEFQTTRIETSGVHGTGCAFASAVAARLALGDSLIDAIARAQDYVGGVIRSARPVAF